jgi:hypothetical protein
MTLGDSHSAGQEILLFLWNLMVHYWTHKKGCHWFYIQQDESISHHQRFHIVTWQLTTKIVEPEETGAARERLLNISQATNMWRHNTKLLEMVLYSEHELDNLFSRECEVIWSHGLGVRQSPASNNVGRRWHYWDPLLGNNWWRYKRLSGSNSEKSSGEMAIVLYFFVVVCGSHPQWINASQSVQTMAAPTPIGLHST